MCRLSHSPFFSLVKFILKIYFFFQKTFSIIIILKVTNTIELLIMFRLFALFLCSGRAEALLTDCISKYCSGVKSGRNFPNICAHHFRHCCI